MQGNHFRILLTESVFNLFIHGRQGVSRIAGGILCLTLLLAIPTQSAQAVAARSVTLPFLYTFNVDGVLEEAGSMSESSSPYFWVNSGGKFLIEQGIGGTIQGALSTTDPWRVLYQRTNPFDTDQGRYPQNIFRLLTRSVWTNASQEVRFKIDATHLTNTPNRNGYSGILLMGRYRDSDNLYYVGIRMDGQAVIKKKYHGTYYTLATAQVFPGTYDALTNPNLIPAQTWMRLRGDVRTRLDGSVDIVLSLDRGSGVYQTIVSARDTKAYGGGVLTGGYAGIRTDYMDVLFDNYRIEAY